MVKKFKTICYKKNKNTQKVWYGTMDITEILKKNNSSSLCHSQNEYSKTKLTKKLKTILQGFLCTLEFIDLLPASVTF